MTMTDQNIHINVLMMAAGTGGHVFPALAVAEELQKLGAKIFWLGTPSGMEKDLVAWHGYPFFAINMQGLRNKGVVRLLKLPLMLFFAVKDVKKLMQDNQIDVAIGFGGYVSAPGGLAARWCKIPLMIHEQNAVAGMSNRNLARYADKVFQAFDSAFGADAITVGNPIRSHIDEVASPERRYDIQDASALKVLVVGGSLGAQAINQAIVQLLQTSDRALFVKHQCGKNNHQAMLDDYKRASIDKQKHTVELMPFIEDMAKAYTWADVVICRAGALTVSEIANVGVAAIFIPLPHAVDDHQTVNAKSLTEHGAGILLAQHELSTGKLNDIVQNLTRANCLAMAQKARSFAKSDVAKNMAQLIYQSLR